MYAPFSSMFICTPNESNQGIVVKRVNMLHMVESQIIAHDIKVVRSSGIASEVVRKEKVHNCKLSLAVITDSLSHM